MSTTSASRSPSRGVLVVAFTTGAILDTYGYIEDSSGNVLASNDDGGEGANFHVVAAGGCRHLLHPSSCGYLDSQTGPYTLHVEVREPDDHGNSPSARDSRDLAEYNPGRPDPR